MHVLVASDLLWPTFCVAEAAELGFEELKFIHRIGYADTHIAIEVAPIVCVNKAVVLLCEPHLGALARWRSRTKAVVRS